ncbi:MAG TPA: hypothetical protein VFQ65_23765 [Kofleriaceae bacterium]|nr:hypothetical protein [Kofleriaceae bacterium]
MGRFESTRSIDVPDLEHSVVALPWGVLRGAFGPSDGSAGAGSNVPSAISVLRHAPLYLKVPEEIDEAFGVLEQHAIRHGVVYPVAITIVPFLFDIVRRGSPVAERTTDLIAEYASAAATLEPRLAIRLREVIADQAAAIVSWLGIHDRAAAALALHVPALREPFFARLATLPRLAPEVLLALIELDTAPPPHAIAVALQLLDGDDVTLSARMCAAAFLARFGEKTPSMRTRIDAALPPSAPAALRAFVGKLWTPTVKRPVVAPKLYDAEVVFAGENLVLVRAGTKSVTLPWAGAPVGRGDVIRVGITAHGQPKLALITEPDGSVTVVDF